MPNGCGTGIASASGGPSITASASAGGHVPAGVVLFGRIRLGSVPRGQGALGETVVRVADGDVPGAAGGRIDSTRAIAWASVSGARTNERTAPSGPMKIWVGRPGGR